MYVEMISIVDRIPKLYTVWINRRRPRKWGVKVYRSAQFNNWCGEIQAREDWRGEAAVGSLGQLELRFNNKFVELDAQGIVTVRELAKATAATINARTPQYFPLINLDPIPFRRVRIMVGKLRVEGRQHLLAKCTSALSSFSSSATRKAFIPNRCHVIPIRYSACFIYVCT
jgi:hypothetical protein